MFRKRHKSKWITIFFVVIASVIGYFLHNRELRIQHERDIQTLSLQWIQGSNAATSFPGDENWLRDQGVYLVNWSWPQRGQTSTNYLTMLQYVGTSSSFTAPGDLGTNRFFTLKSNLISGYYYRVEKKKGVTRLKRLDQSLSSR